MPISEKLPLYAAVAVSDTAYAFDKLFGYSIPTHLRERAAAGVRVLVPFGRGNRRRIGMILALEYTPPEQQLKPILNLLDEEPVLNEEQRDLAFWLREHTFCTYFEAVKTVLPAGMQYRLTPQYQLAEAPAECTLSAEESALLSFLQRAKTGAELDAMLDTTIEPEKRSAVEGLLEKGILLRGEACRRQTQDSFEKTIRLSARYLEGEPFLLTDKQRRLAALLEETGAVSVKEACYLCGITAIVAKNLQKMGAAELYDTEVFRDLPEEAEPTQPPEQLVLSQQQQRAYDQVQAQLVQHQPYCYLLHGVTGSGKTAVFQKLIDFVLRDGRQAMLLLPEIALTPQIVARFRAMFGSAVAVLHSGLPLSQRLDAAKRIQQGEARIVIGTRSAVFAPLPDIGLVILDEEGERSYKSDSAPRYHAVDVAKQRCRTHGAVLLLASATPSIESYFYAQKGLYTLLTMTERYAQSALPEVSVVDMNEERAAGNSTEFSNLLVDSLRENLSRGEQSILLLNRRGYHTILQCVSCGEPLYCPNCSVPMTFHKVNGSLLCHYCGHAEPLRDSCPRCDGRLKHMGFGTQKLEEALSELLPKARILRMDADTTFSRCAYEEKLTAFGLGEYDILVGTQMIGKGLDFPNVTLVGVLSIDKALFSGDFRSYERTFSLVTQVVGRGGRGARAGRAVLQTFMPEHYVLSLAAQQSYERFYQEEIQLRRTLILPPFCDICTIGLSSVMESGVQKAAETLLQMLRDKVRAEQVTFPLRVLGPVPCAYGRINGKYRWRLLLKCKNTADLRRFVSELLVAAGGYRDFAKVTLYADMNGDIGV